MITKNQASKLAYDTIPAEAKAIILDVAENKIKAAAAEGKLSVAFDNKNLKPVEEEFLRNTLRLEGFSISEVGFIVYW